MSPSILPRTGLVSISFRNIPATDLPALVAGAGLAGIEWGSDVHAPPRLDGAESPEAAQERLRALARATRAAGVAVTSYGTYFRLGATPDAEFPAYLEAARALGAPLVRVWAGTHGFAQMAREERDAVLRSARDASARAADAGVSLCTECHPGTATDCPEGAAFLLDGAPALSTYWQPNQYHDIGWNLDYLRLVAPRAKLAHVFHWTVAPGGPVVRHPLAEGAAEWRRYLAELPPSAPLMLEFMPDDSPASLPREAAALRALPIRCAGTE